MAKAKTQPKVISRPQRDPDHYSKRGVPYWWAPEWVRGTSSDFIHNDKMYASTSIMNNQGELLTPCNSYGKIAAVKDKKTKEVDLFMKSKAGDYTYIQGSIQDEFKAWHEDRQIDYILFGLDPDELLNDES